MRFRWIAALCAGLTLLAIAPSAAALDRDAFTFTHYDLKVSLDPARHTLHASGEVELRNDSKQPQRDVALQISSTLRWRRIESHGEELPFVGTTYTTDIDHTGALSEAVVHLPQEVPAGSTLKFEIAYDGTVIADATRLTRIGTPETTALRSDWDQLGAEFTALRGIGYVTWYPVSLQAASLANGNEVFDTLATWKQRHQKTQLEVAFAWPASGWRMASNGEQHAGTSSAARSGDGANVLFSAGKVPVFVLGDLESMQRENVNLFYTEAHTAQARDFAIAAEKDIPVLQDWFGRPRRKMVVVELTNPNALPFEAGPFLFAPLRQIPANALETALARELVHASFSSPRPWIEGGLAAFGQALIRERQTGRKGALGYLNQFADTLTTADRPGVVPSQGAPAVAPQPLVSTNDDLFFRTKAAFVWWMLRDMVGDDALRAALQSYRASEDREPSYLQRLIESRSTTHASLEKFFDDWVYRDLGLPDFRIDSMNTREILGGGYMIAVTVENLGGCWAEVPVVVRSEKGERSERVAVAGHAKATVRITYPQLPDQVVVNDGSVPESDVANNTAKIEPPQTRK